jgi:predicted acetyltransferase
MDVRIRTIAPEEFDAFEQVLASSFHEFPRPEEVELERALGEFDRTFVALDAGRMVGGAVTASLAVGVPGGELPFAGVVGVGVAPTHRRRGVATALMRAQLDHIHERGEPLAGLYASEGGIYGRFGYGVATYSCGMRLTPARSAFVRMPSEPGRMRLLERAEAFDVLAPVFDAVRREQPGLPSRPSDAWWELRFFDHEGEREGASALHFAVHEGDVGADAYAVYRFKHEWPQEIPEGVVDVVEVMATTPSALANIWRYVFDLDLAGRVMADDRPIDDPLLALLAEPRQLRLTVRDGMWLRIVDVAQALAGRRYRGGGRLVLDVRDEFCPWNQGRYALEAGPDGAQCRRTGDEADVALSATELGSVYLGGVRFGQLARAGLLDERTAGSIRRADELFAWDPAPWCPNVL